MDQSGFRRAPLTDMRPGIRDRLMWRTMNSPGLQPMEGGTGGVVVQPPVEEPAPFGFVPAGDWIPRTTPLARAAGLQDVTGAAERAGDDVQRQAVAALLHSLRGGAPMDISPEVIEMMLRREGRL